MDIREKCDSEIIASVLLGDTEAFAVIVERHKNRVFKIIASHVPPEFAEETANDVFFKAYKSLKTFKNEAPFINWLSVIAVRACKDYWRINYARKDVPFSSLTEEAENMIAASPGNTGTPEEFLVDNETKNMLRKALEKLKPAERMVIEMIYRDEMSVAETAEVMEMTESNVKVTAFRARKKLAKLMNAIYGGSL